MKDSRFEKPELIYEMSISEVLHDNIYRYCSKSKLLTSHYDHGHNTTRDYTAKFCMQETKWKGKTYYKLKSGGRPPSRYHKYNQEQDRLDEETPSFETLIGWIARKYSQHVFKIKRCKDEPIPWELPKQEDDGSII